MDRQEDGIAKLAATLRANPHAEWSDIRGLVDGIISARQREQVLNELQDKRSGEAAATARVTAEPSPYGEDSPHSWTLDVASVTAPDLTIGARGSDMRPEAVQERLRKHAIDVGRAVRSQSDPWGREIRAQLGERTRHDDPVIHRRNAEAALAEYRTFGTGGGATASAAGGGAAAFVSPYFLLGSWAPYRGIQRAFVDQCRSENMPDYGMEVYVPVFTAGTKAGQQTEGSAVTEATPTAGLEGAEVKNVAGMLIVTEQLHARGFAGGGSFDKVVGQQLQEQLDQELDLYVLNQAITNGEAVAGAAEYKTVKLYEDLAKGREKLADVAGTRLRPTHLFTTSDFYGFVSRQVDATTERPIIQPWYITGYPAATSADDYDGEPEPPFSRFTGTVMPGGVLWMTDDNVPAVGTTTKTQLLVSAPAVAITVCEGAPFLGLFRETFANELRVVLQLRSYVAAITRHKAGTAIISGEGYKTTQV